MAELEDELISFRYPEITQAHDDLIDALAYQLEIIYKPNKVINKEVPYLSPLWLEEKFGRPEAKADIANPYVYKR
ncbi:MAG: hypothetical protein BWY74_04382 [Firmicutes bacterium ADurb.Bin419]|nr:MAG: hypothetical protein BWY74_04382 [Firmicutes bacterium ADurb.Bin419]